MRQVLNVVKLDKIILSLRNLCSQPSELGIAFAENLKIAEQALNLFLSDLREKQKKYLELDANGSPIVYLADENGVPLKDSQGEYIRYSPDYGLEGKEKIKLVYRVLDPQGFQQETAKMQQLDLSDLLKWKVISREEVEKVCKKEKIAGSFLLDLLDVVIV